MDIYLGDLYYRFTKLLKPELVNQLHGFFTAGTADKQQAQIFVESLKETAEKYFETVKYYITGADGKFEPWPENMEQGASANKVGESSEQAPTKLARAMSKEQLWEEFKGYIERLIGLAGYLNASGKKPQDKLLKELALRIKEKQLVCAAALGYGLLSALRSIIGKADGSLAANLAFEHWELDRKLKEQFRIFGANDGTPSLDDAVWRLGEICKSVLCRTGADNSDRVVNKKTAEFDAGNFAASLIIENHPHEDFRRLIGVNVFDDVSWFNKEAFESALFYGKLFFVLESDSAYPMPRIGEAPMPWLERAGRIAEVVEAMEKAEIASGYRLQNLIQLLTGESAPQASVPPASAPPAANKKAKTGKRKKRDET
jgi:hypothetical protein